MWFVKRWRMAVASAAGFAAAISAAGCGILPMEDTASFADPSVTSRSAAVVTVQTVGSLTGDGSCGLPRVRFTTTETRETVRITVHATSLNDGRACAAVAYGPTGFDVRLRAPLGDRAVIDEQTDVVRPVLDGSTVPTIARLPAGYRERALGFGMQDGVDGWFRAWSPSEGRELYPAVSLFVTTSDLPRRRDGETVTVGGREVTIATYVGSSSDSFSLQWRLDAEHDAFIDVDARHGSWTRRAVLDLVLLTRL